MTGREVAKLLGIDMSKAKPSFEYLAALDICEHVFDGCDGGICVMCGACNHEECA